jgi:NitT/TauT family transport system permease protein
MSVSVKKLSLNTGTVSVKPENGKLAGNKVKIRKSERDRLSSLFEEISGSEAIAVDASLTAYEAGAAADSTELTSAEILSYGEEAAPGLRKKFMGAFRKFVNFLKGIVGIFAFFALWEFASRIGLIDSIFIPPFTKVVKAFWELTVNGSMLINTAVSLRRALIGLGIGIGVALPLGLIIGQFPRVARFLNPILETFRQTSVLALLPVFILLLGIGETSKVAMIFWGTQWPVLLSTISGVKNVDPTYVMVSRSMNESQFGVFRKVILPSAMPQIFTGIRLAATGAIMLLIAAEMVGAQSGLGFAVFDFEVKYEIPKMFAVIVMFSILGLVLNYVLVHVESRIIRWRPDQA